MLPVRFPYRARCRWCGKRFLKKPGERTRDYRKRRFCSEACKR